MLTYGDKEVQSGHMVRLVLLYLGQTVCNGYAMEVHLPHQLHGRLMKKLPCQQCSICQYRHTLSEKMYKPF